MYSYLNFVLFLLLNFVFTNGQQDTDPYSHREILDSRGNYQLEWSVHWPQNRVNFTITVATRGYVAFGLARNAKMDGADIIMGGVFPNGTTYFSDRHAIGNQQPILDQSQDWILHSAQENDSHTTLSFSRAFDTCDSHDVPINTYDAVYLMWSFGETDNLTEYHFQNRGAHLAYLLDPDLTPRSIRDWNTQANLNYTANNLEETRPIINGTERWAIREQFLIPPKETTYWCRVHKFTPPVAGKKHMIGYNFRINPEALQNMHHLLLYRCRPPLLDAKLLYSPFVNGSGQECYMFDRPNGPIPTMFCTELILGHAIGGYPAFLPEHMGISLGETSSEEYFLLQVHYDNPDRRPDIQSDLQLDLYYTENLRENDGGIWSLGHHIPGSPSLLLPPGEREHRFYGHCSSGCTRKMLPRVGINFVGVLLHTHVAGRRIRLKHFRNGRELPWILGDDNFKFQFQPFRILREERRILPGDQISVECLYDTTEKNRTTVGGYGTQQEMCKVFLLYYNKLEGYPVCRSEINNEEYMGRYLAGLQNVTWDESRLEYQATWPPNLAGRTLSNISDSVEFGSWDRISRAQLRGDHITLPQQSVCPSVTEAAIGALFGVEGAPLEPVAYPVHVTEWQPPQRCALGRGK